MGGQLKGISPAIQGDKRAHIFRIVILTQHNIIYRVNGQRRQAMKLKAPIMSDTSPIVSYSLAGFDRHSILIMCDKKRGEGKSTPKSSQTRFRFLSHIVSNCLLFIHFEGVKYLCSTIA